MDIEGYINTAKHHLQRMGLQVKNKTKSGFKPTYIGICFHKYPENIPAVHRVFSAVERVAQQQDRLKLLFYIRQG